MDNISRNVLCGGVFAVLLSYVVFPGGKSIEAQAASPAPWFAVVDPAMASHLDNRVVLEWKGKVKAGNSGNMDVAIFRDTQTDARFYVTWWPNVPESTSVTAYPVIPGKTQEVKVER